jgi:hypothetical protein
MSNVEAMIAVDSDDGAGISFDKGGKLNHAMWFSKPVECPQLISKCSNFQKGIVDIILTE